MAEQAQPLDFPAVLNFLHAEWRRFERERTEWELECADLKAKLQLLEGERRGFEVVKQDLLKRIKMLEYALRQERYPVESQVSSLLSYTNSAKYLSSSTGQQPATTLEPLADKPEQPQKQEQEPVPEKKDFPAVVSADMSASFSAGRSMTLGKGRNTKTRELLKQYLQEIGYAEGQTGTPAGKQQLPSIMDKNWSATPAPQSTQSQQPKGGADYAPKIMQRTPKESPNNATMTQQNTVEMRETPNNNNERRERVTETIYFDSSNGATPPPSFQLPSDPKAQNMMQKWDKMFANSGTIALKSTSNTNGAPAEGDPTSPTKKKKGKSKGLSASSSASSMDSELADLDLNDPDAEEAKDASDKTAKAANESRLWRPKYTMRGHLDAVHAMAFHPTDVKILTGSEDGTIKYWNLEPLLGLKKAPMDIEPVLTFRNHESSVNCLAVTTMIPPSDAPDLNERLQHGLFFSAGFDGVIRLWAMPSPDLAPYSKYEYKKYQVGSLSGHEDVIWDLKVHPMRPMLASLASDGAIKLWNLNKLGEPDMAQTACMSTIWFEENKSAQCVPTSLDFVHSDLTKFVGTYSNASMKLYDIETSKAVMTFKDSDCTYDGTHNTQINRVICHPTQSLAITAHEDKHVRFFDTRSGDCAHSMVAHLDAVSTLDISPNGLVVVTGGHDSSVRLWDLNTHACLQEFSAHRKKYDESLHSVLFHPRMVTTDTNSATGDNGDGNSVQGGSRWLATAGADACVKLYSCS